MLQEHRLNEVRDRIKIQTDDFDINTEVERLYRGDLSVGAVVSFVGLVRDINDNDVVSSLTLEHYPGMTEKSIAKILAAARQRWQLCATNVVHRVGTLQPQDQIVYVGVASPHRGEAFAACEFVMDYLKTNAQFWKKEVTADGSRWLESRVADKDALKRWESPD